MANQEPDMAFRLILHSILGSTGRLLILRYGHCRRPEKFTSCCGLLPGWRCTLSEVSGGLIRAIMSTIRPF